MKRLLSLIMAALIMTHCAIALSDEVPVEGAQEESYTRSDVEAGVADAPIEVDSPAFVSLLLQIAQAEIGYVEGPNNLSKYGEWSGDKNAAWCAEFVCWCVNQTDMLHGTKLLDEVYPNYSGRNVGRDWFITKGRFVNRKGNVAGWGYQWMRGDNDILRKNDYIPRPGDLVFFSYNGAGDTEHVALVEYSALTGDGRVIIHVIEGNNPDRVQRNTYYLDNSQVLGFGICQDLVDTTIRFGNAGDKVLKLQRDLNFLGILGEKHLTGTFGSNTRRAVTDVQRGMDGKTPSGVADMQTQYEIMRLVEQKQNAAPETWLVSD